jgi:hypothetical protein
VKLRATDIEALKKVERASHNTCRVSPCKKYYPESYVHPSTARRLAGLGLAVVDRQYSLARYERPHLFIHLTEAGREALNANASASS